MRASEFITEGYKEIEFLCANPEFPDATDPKKQEKLFHSLRKIKGVIPLYQDWEDYSEGQKSLTAIYKHPDVKKQVLDLAKQLDVKIDLIKPVSDEYVDRAVRGKHDGQITEDFQHEPLYHATLKAFEPSIMKFGLLPGGNLRMFDWSENKYVYLSNYPDVAQSFVDPSVIEPKAEDEGKILDLMKQGGVMFKIDQDKLDRKKLTADPHFNTDADDGAETYIYTGTIPPSAIIGKTYFGIDI